ncbi:MAG: PstS family phosphate ABC transporter substrate-binding protein [Bacteroidales bacterium]|nr:PstS family phosphate ABC transporter substrate-binding protein [Bacteroidales bacterium]
MKKSILCLMLITAIFLSSCVSDEKKEQTISLSGAFALYPMVVKWSEEYQKENPDIRFNISAGGAGKGIADAMAETVDLGMFSRTISDEEKEKGVWWIGVCKDAVIPTISCDNPYLNILLTRGVTQKEFKAIYIDGTIKTWGELLGTDDKTSIVVYTRSDACGAAGIWAEFLGEVQEDLIGVGVYGDPGLADVVIKDNTGIAYNNTAYVYDIKTGKKRPGIEVIPIDINNNGKIDPEENFYDNFEDVLKAIAEGDYPSPPARELYLVANGKPEKKSTIKFMKWILTDGQKFIKEAGFVPLKQEQIDVYIEKLEK